MLNYSPSKFCELHIPQLIFEKINSVALSSFRYFSLALQYYIAYRNTESITENFYRIDLLFYTKIINISKVTTTVSDNNQSQKENCHFSVRLDLFFYLIILFM